MMTWLPNGLRPTDEQRPPGWLVGGQPSARLPRMVGGTDDEGGGGDTVGGPDDNLTSGEDDDMTMDQEADADAEAVDEDY